MSRLSGNLHGLKPSQIKNVERLLVRRTDRSRIIGVNLARELGELAWNLGRNVGVLLDRTGHVKRALIGDMHSVPVPTDLGPPPQPGRLKGLRLVRTELACRKELPDLDREQLLRHRLDALARLELDALGEVLWVRHASLDPVHMGDADPDTRLIIDRDRARLSALSEEFPEELEALEEEIGRRALGLEHAGRGERAVLIVAHDGDPETARMQMAELCELSRSALMNVVGETSQRREKPDPRTYVGRGKVSELCRLSVKHAADHVVVGSELSGVQLRNLEDRIGVPVIDRTELVLRIFERRAETRAARLRVALARLRYQLPRIVVQEHGMSRIARGSVGGAGTRGKGEPYLELSRRRMRERIHRLESILERVARQQRTGRRKRGRSGIPICSLVGYTNAGKSSWLNALTDAEACAESLLFATLDTTARRTRLPGGTDTILTDTVGFLRDLPRGLLDAFRSTLEELSESSLLVHVVDISAEDWEEKDEAVLATLESLNATQIPRLTLWNKSDLVDRGAFRPLAAKRRAHLVSVHDRADRARVRHLIEGAVRAGSPWERK